MVLLKKTLQVEERYPYPVRLEAMYEVIDQSPMRKLEKIRQKGFVQKCKGAGVEGQVEEATLTGESRKVLRFLWLSYRKDSLSNLIKLCSKGCKVKMEVILLLQDSVMTRESYVVSYINH